eukprot:TRINITY_DN6027_c0_g1_i2.p1 TRINITY_DN6027_c0_g1~~TRINITY_DN6027_c0_g1_i2.p1  ORF type:complete len:224 (+),score=67.39 TRINITY_DN6027_c0_g1_i2:56-673(+)
MLRFVICLALLSAVLASPSISGQFSLSFTVPDVNATGGIYWDPTNNRASYIKHKPVCDSAADVAWCGATVLDLKKHLSLFVQGLPGSSCQLQRNQVFGDVPSNFWVGSNSTGSHMCSGKTLPFYEGFFSVLLPILPAEMMFVSPGSTTDAHARLAIGFDGDTPACVRATTDASDAAPVTVKLTYSPGEPPADKFEPKVVAPYVCP